MELEQFEKMFGLSDCNCTYTTTSGQQGNLSIEALFEVMSKIPDRPKIFTMDINIMSHPFLNGNTILVGKDIADELDKIFNKTESSGSEK